MACAKVQSESYYSVEVEPPSLNLRNERLRVRTFYDECPDLYCKSKESP